MKTLTLTEKQARDIYPTASPELKTILENSFTKEFFQQKPFERIKTLEDVYKEIDEDYPGHLDLPSHVLAYMKACAIAKAFNDGWFPNWDDSDEQKWFPWFYLDGGFRFGDANCHYSTSDVGSRLCFRDRETCEYAAKQFLHIYKTLFTYSQ